MKKIQKLFTLPIVIILLFSIACKEQNKNAGVNNTEDQLPKFDSIQVLQIEEKVNKINDAVQIQRYPTLIPFPIYNAIDTLKYWNLDGKPARISVVLNYPDRNVWPTFFVKDGELVFVRSRLWVKSAPSYAMESMIYLSGDDIIHCTARHIDLEEGELPTQLRKKEFSTCLRPSSEIKKDYEDYWKTISTFLEENTVQKK